MRAPSSCGLTTRSAPACVSLAMLSSCAGTGDDEQPRVDRPPRERHEQVLGVARQRHDERLGAVDAGGAHRLVERGVADDRRQGDARRRARASTSTTTTSRPRPWRCSATARPTRPQPHTTTCPGRSAILRSIRLLPTKSRQPPLDDQLHAQREGVQHRPDAGDDDGDREPLLGGAELTDLAEAHRRDRRDGLVQGVEEREAEQPVADRAHHEDGADDPEGQAQPCRRRPHERAPYAGCCAVPVERERVVRAVRRSAPPATAARRGASARCRRRTRRRHRRRRRAPRRAGSARPPRR